MRIATFNVLHGSPHRADGRPVDPTSAQVDGAGAQQPLADAVAALDVDVLALQELDRYQARSGDVDQAEVAATAMGAVDWRYASALHGRAVSGVGWVRDRNAPELGVYGPEDAPLLAMIPSHGTALLTRRPVLHWRARRFPAAPAGLPLWSAGRKALTMVRDHPRVAVAAVLEGVRGPFTIVATHLSFIPGWNAGQLATLRKWVADLPGPQVLLGDLNLTGPIPRAVLVGAELLQGLLNPGPVEHHWHDLARTATYPAHHPLVQFDHVLATGVPSSAVRVSFAPHGSISDHRALVVELPG
jgi:endonuclease/exonuclease/phosphatase family metal-dependent hydrolase